MLKSVLVRDRATIEQADKDPQFPYLVSFPRTGSHWLRMLMELFYEIPALRRVFYFYSAEKYTCLHHHDLELKLSRKRVIYLYRNPIDTIYSQLKYHKCDFTLSPVLMWSDLYAQHLSKWLIEESFTTDKLTIRYEDLQQKNITSFKRLSEFLKLPWNVAKFEAVFDHVSREEVYRRTRHDPQVIDLSESYQNERIRFTELYGEVIVNRIMECNKALDFLVSRNGMR